MRDRDRLELQRLREENLLRHTRSWRREGVLLHGSDGRKYVDFSSNDYLGLSQHPALVAAAKEATDLYGVGSAGSRLISGTSPAHEQCESRIAFHKETEAALILSTGMMAAQAGVKSLFGREDTIILDKLSHACLVDAARECGARIRVFPHNDLNKLESLLRTESARLNAGGRLGIIVESVYSMDGDLCPLAEVVTLKEKYDAFLLVDEAHGLGVMGEAGMGLADSLGLHSRIDLQMGTLGKAAGGAGGYLACSQILRDTIVNKGRSFIFTTAPPPAQAAVASVAIDLIASPVGEELRKKLDQNLHLFSDLSGHPLSSAICPVILGSNEAALNASERLMAAGFYAPAVRYPTVAQGAARLRVTLSALHSDQQIAQLWENISPHC